MDVNQSTASVAGAGEIASFEEKLCPLTVRNILDFYDDFNETIWAFRALIELIGTSDSKNFANEENMRFGLEKLLFTCLEKQETQVEALLQVARNSPEYCLELARSISNAVMNGTIIDPKSSRDVRSALENIDLIISVFGEERYPEAEIIRKRLLSKIKVS
ncbi:MAG: hypothetical protein ACD_15C00093G0003 [uncultured bacterium]|nr:MAG: hypothetical protein ACD_15C00093G0003 [uncultured bacterium]